MKVFSKITGTARHDPDRDRIEMMRCHEERRLQMVRAQAIGELRRLAGLTPDASGKVDPVRLDAALVLRNAE